MVGQRGPWAGRLTHPLSTAAATSDQRTNAPQSTNTSEDAAARGRVASRPVLFRDTGSSSINRSVLGASALTLSRGPARGQPLRLPSVSRA